MKTPAFWYQKTQSWQSIALTPLSLLYGTAVFITQKRTAPKAAKPIICIGNLTTGGSGKTPFCLYLGKLLEKQGKKIAIISRGYGGSFHGIKKVSPKTHKANEVGDEPLMMAAHFPLWVGANRKKTATAASKTANIILMDDGFQNRSVEKHLTLIVINGNDGFGNGRLFPAGPLRQSPNQAQKKIDAFIVIGKLSDKRAKAFLQKSKKPLFEAEIKPDPMNCKGNAIAFCGIARSERFFKTLEAKGATLLARYDFGDHYPFTEQDAQMLLAEAKKKNARLYMTEKDKARLEGAPKGSASARLLQQAKALPLTLALKNEARFAKWLNGKIR